jgi:hypothetical protein
MAARRKIVSGTTMVTVAVTATVATLGFTAFYLPFVADREKMRGLHEESDVDPKARREYEEYVRQHNKREQQAQAQHPQQYPAQQAQQQEQAPANNMPTSNSMWARMNNRK